VRIYWEECCRNSAITTGAAGNNFYIEAVINRCSAANNPCNSSPEFSNEPFAILCGGQGFVFNNGAIDPDHDSLTYSFAPCLTATGTSVSYLSPYTAAQPMPFYPPANGSYPLGIKCDSSTGDIMFTPSYGASGAFVGVMAVEIKQWRIISGITVCVGTTRRDMQLYLITCAPNHPPTIMTDPSNVIQPKLSWQVCAGDQICFYVIGKDTDYLPYNTPIISDTTYLSWNAALASKGATFLPTYNLSNRKTTGPREDKYQFCWQPTDSNASTLPYYFTVTTKDNRCPYTGQSTRAFSITVLSRANVSIVKTDLRCGYWKVTFVNNKPSQTLTSTVWNISRVANDFSGINVSTYLNATTPPAQHFTVPGKYLVELDVNTTGVSGGNPCQAHFFDTITVDTFVQVFVPDTSLCYGKTITIPNYGKWGQPPYTFRWFYPPDTFSFPLNAPFFASNSFTINPQITKRYTVQIRDFNGCRAYDSNVIVTVDQPIIGNIIGPKNINTISSPVIYSTTAQVKDTFIWSVFGGNILSGQGTDSINVLWSSNGIKSVSLIATDSNKCYDSIGENITINVGINKLNGFSNLSVFPNPTSGILNIEFETSEKNIQIEVLDMIGKSILKNTTKHNGGLFQKTLNISQLNEGFYFLKITAGEKSTTVKVTLNSTN
jgi:hypothetical protein